MISFKINGRLGNQLFQLAAAYSLSLKIGKKKKILPDERSGVFTVTEYFDTPIQYPLSWQLLHSLIQKLPKKLKPRLSKHLLSSYYEFIGHKIYSPKHPMQIDHEFFNVQDNTCLDGYFQSEYYFKSVANEIKHTFKVKEKFQQEWKKLYKTWPNHTKLVAVHIRLGDYKSQAGWNMGAEDMTLPKSYYQELISQYSNEENLVVILSDEPKVVQEWFKPSTRLLISEESLIVDFITLTKAHVCILSHSSFSWWGAWLNTNPNPSIYVPEFFLGFRKGITVPENIIPDQWIKIKIQHESAN